MGYSSYVDFYKELEEKQMISSIWKYIAEMIYISLKDNSYKESSLVLFLIYFSLIDDGNTCMSLDQGKLIEKWKKKVNDQKVMITEKKRGFADDKSIKEIEKSFDNLLKNSEDEIKRSLQHMNSIELSEVISESNSGNNNAMFVVDNGWLYLRKYDIARKKIAERAKVIFAQEYPNDPINYKDFVIKKENEEDEFTLKAMQKEAVENGCKRNLLITGGPGTGKTSSIIFILIGLLLKDQNYEIHLVAPSGKASSRMKESILDSLNKIKPEFKQEHKDIVDIISNVEESTIHRKLSRDYSTGRYLYNSEKQFSKNSIFVIDEASMIDISLFSALLQAIPDEARVFIMGDKDQLPSVECGAVFADLLEIKKFEKNIIVLNESNRFESDSSIDKLAKAVNSGKLSEINMDWESLEKDSSGKCSFDQRLEEVMQKENSNKKDSDFPIYYFNLELEKKKQLVKKTVEKWAQAFYISSASADKKNKNDSLFAKAKGIDTNKAKNKTQLEEIFKLSERAKILCAENEGEAGVKTINKIVSKYCMSKSENSGNYRCPGNIMMINQNNKSLDLYNGDSGILVSFKNDDTVYFMIKKTSTLISKDKYVKDSIFKLHDFMFYPIRMIKEDEIDLAFAITIHKSQGSGYSNILVILPTNKSHPLLNRQIVYTAITRTKGNTFILANDELLKCASENVLTRDTNIEVN